MGAPDAERNTLYKGALEKGKSSREEELYRKEYLMERNTIKIL